MLLEQCQWSMQAQGVFTHRATNLFVQHAIAYARRTDPYSLSTCILALISLFSFISPLSSYANWWLMPFLTPPHSGQGPIHSQKGFRCPTKWGSTAMMKTIILPEFMFPWGRSWGMMTGIPTLPPGQFPLYFIKYSIFQCYSWKRRERLFSLVEICNIWGKCRILCKLPP